MNRVVFWFYAKAALLNIVTQKLFPYKFLAKTAKKIEAYRINQ